MFLQKYRIQLCWSLVLVLVSACAPGDGDSDGDDDGADEGEEDGDDSDDSGDEGEDDDGPVACEDDTDEDGNIVVVARDEQNYAFESSMDIQSTVIRAGSDFTIDWSAIDTDMLGQDLDPLNGVNMMTVMLWQYTHEELMENMDNDSLDTQFMVAMGYVWTENNLSSAQYLDVLSPSGGEWPDEDLLAFMDPAMYPPDSHTYFVTVSDPPTLSFGTDVRMVHLFSVDADENNTTIDLTNNSTVINYTADIHSLDPIRIPAATPDVILDWSDTEALTVTGKGQTFIPNRITDVMLAHYASKTPADLEQDFLNLEHTADDLYRIFLTAGQSVNLGTLEDEEGNTFPGIDDEGTWIVALICGRCSNPAPWYFTVLETCGG